MTRSRIEMAAQVARDIPDLSYVNLGIGIPTLVADHVPPGKRLVLHTENGMLGMGPAPEPGTEHPDLINAGKMFVTEGEGASYFHHADSFAMVRGGHIQYAVMGAYQVSVDGDLANWRTNSEDTIPAVGGAMDLAAGAQHVYIIMDLFTKSGEPKLVSQCTYPLTGRRCVERVYTDYAVFEIREGGVAVRELAPLVTFDELRARLDVPLIDATAVHA